MAITTFGAAATISSLLAAQTVVLRAQPQPSPTAVDTMATTSSTDLEVAAAEPPVMELVTDKRSLRVLPTRTKLPIPTMVLDTCISSAKKSRSISSFSQGYTTSTINCNSMDDENEREGDQSRKTALTIGMGIVASLAAMSIVIIFLILALFCSLRRKRKLRREATTTKTCRPRRRLDSTSMDKMLDEGVAGHMTSILTEHNVAYHAHKRRSSDEYEEDYVINELVYASIHQRDSLPLADSPSSNIYYSILDTNPLNRPPTY